VKGKFVTLDELFSDTGVTANASGLSDAEPVRLVRRDGKLYVGDCEELQSLGGSFGSGGSGTDTRVTIATTPQAARTGPGSSRTSPVKLGSPAKVDDTWEIAVVTVVRDAWPILSKNSFNDPPAAGERMLLVTLKARNVSSSQQPESISDFSVRLTGSRNELYSTYSEKTNCGIVPNELEANLFPGGQTEGNVCFRVPADERDLVLAWEPFFSDGFVYFSLD
jgi:hypothetical protein